MVACQDVPPAPERGPRSVCEAPQTQLPALLGVQPLSVVDNSVFSPNHLTVLSTLFILLYKEASLLPISSGEDSSDSSCVLALALVCPHVLSRAAVFPKLSPSWSCKGRPKPPGVPRSNVFSSHAPHTIAPPVASAAPTRLLWGLCLSLSDLGVRSKAGGEHQSG